MGGNPLRYVNGAKTSQQRKSINCKMHNSGGKVYYCTTKAVKQGEEFLVDYGKHYWEGLLYNTRLGEIRARQNAIKSELRKAKGFKRERLQEELEDAVDEETELREEGVGEG